MDDPWGSPWATSTSNTSSPTKTQKPDLEPPPRAFLSTSAASSPRPSISGPSPWADDANDGFGDWGGSNAWNPSPRLSPSLGRQDSFDRLSPIALPGNTATGSKIARQRSPSLDPWASEDAWKAPAEVIPTPRLELNGFVELEERTHAEPAKVGLVLKRKNEAANETKDLALDDRIPNHGLVTREAGEGHSQPIGTSSAQLEPKPPAQDQIPHDAVEFAESRPPSLSDRDDASDLDIERQDSPITSIDEDSRTRTHIARRPSGKVQLMVEKFDGIAKKALEDPLPVVRRERSKSRAQDGIDKDGDADFGDSEDAEDGDEGEATIKAPVPPPVPETPQRVAARTPLPVSPPSPLIDKAALTARFGPIAFTPDLSIIDQLFETSTLDSLEPLPDPTSSGPLTDRILTDSFAGISERKTWYRVSRLGSARQHDAGDLDRYTRVTWKNSTVWMDTLKTIRRWMEEDSLTGRPMLGGFGGVKGNMFGWGTEVEEADLERVFGRKSHSRTSSTQGSPPQQRKMSITGGSLTHQRKTSTMGGSPTHQRNKSGVPVASFGWSTGPGSDAVALEDGTTAWQQPSQPAKYATPPVLNGMIAPPPRAPSPVRTSTESRKESLERDTSPERTPARKTDKTPQALDIDKLKAVTPDDEEDDDEWGEMVSSPTDTTAGQGAGFASLDAVSMADSGLSPIHRTRADTDIISPLDSTRAETSLLQSRSRTPTLDAFPDPWATADFSSFEPPTSPTKPDTKPAVAEKPASAYMAVPPPSSPSRQLTSTVTSAVGMLSPAPTSATRSIVSPFHTSLMSGRDPEWTPATSEHPFTPTTPLAVMASPVLIPSPKVIPARRSSIGAVTGQVHAPVSPNKVAQKTISPVDEEREEENVTREVRRIVGSLPDLRYMLR